MPAGPANTEAPATDTNVPQQVQPKSFDEFAAGPGPASTNQTTTKPRQTPGGGSVNDAGQPGLGDDSGMDPASNGADVESGEPTQEADGADPKPPVQAKHATYLLADIMSDIRQTNPQVAERDVFHLAKRVIDEYPLTKQAEGWNPLGFGHRGDVRDGPLTTHLHKMKVPQNSPSRQQPTVQKEHGEQVLEGTVVEPQGLPAAPQGIEPKHRRTMVMRPDGQWDWDGPDPSIKHAKAGAR